MTLLTGEDAGARVAQIEVLVRELASPDALSPGAIVAGEVAALAHEVGDDAVEGAAFVSEALLAGAQAPEIFHLFPIGKVETSNARIAAVTNGCSGIRRGAQGGIRRRTVLGILSAFSSMTILPSALPPTSMSRYTLGLVATGSPNGSWYASSAASSTTTGVLSSRQPSVVKACPMVIRKESPNKTTKNRPKK